MSDKTIPVRVVFRAERYGPFAGVPVAVFDDDDVYPLLTTYEHMGQHGTGSYDWYVRTRAATPDEYEGLLAELTARGYAVTVGQRLTTARGAR